MLVYWETTLACGLACRHCRATAQPERNPLELTTDEGYRLLDEILGFGRPFPHVVFTGGDPLRRPDLETLVRAATERGIGCVARPGRHADGSRGSASRVSTRRGSRRSRSASTAPTRSATTASAASPGRSRRRSTRPLGQRGGPADPGQHAGHGRDAARPAGGVRAPHPHGHHALEPVLPDHPGAGARSEISPAESERLNLLAVRARRRRRRSRSRPPRPRTTAGWRSGDGTRRAWTTRRSPRHRWGAGSASATATESCSSPTTAPSTRPGSCRSPLGNVRTASSWTCTASMRS